MLLGFIEGLVKVVWGIIATGCLGDYLLQVPRLGVQCLVNPCYLMCSRNNLHKYLYLQIIPVLTE